MTWMSELEPLPDVYNVPEYELPDGSPSLAPHGFDIKGILKRIIRPYVTIADIFKNRPKIDAAAFAKQYKQEICLQELDADLGILEDRVGLTRVLPNGKVETYPETLLKAESDDIKEAASYGLGIVNKRNIVGFVSNVAFMYASAGTVYGEKIVRAMKLAIRKNIPAFMVYTSGGQRQQEGPAALEWMKISGHFLRKFKDSRRMPLTSIIAGGCWGGVSASDVPEGDIRIGIEDSDIGFAGSGIIEAYSGEPIPQGAKAVESSFLTDRTVQIIVKPEELSQAQKDIVSFAFGDTIEQNQDPSEIEPKLNFRRRGFFTPFQSTIDRSQRAKIPFEPQKPDSVYNQYLNLRSDPNLLDAEDVIQNASDGFFPLYSSWTVHRTDGDHKRYPGIIAALAYIDDPRLSKTKLPNGRLRVMIIGNQPSYLKRNDGSIVQDPAFPTYWDYLYQMDMMKMAERFRIPVISLTHIVGAAETKAQYRAISDCLALQDRLSVLELGFIIGIEGSGGGGASTLDRDHVEILDYGQVYVAEPRSASRILYRNPTPQDIVRTAEQMRPTPDFLTSLRLVDNIINTKENGVQNTPSEIALKIRERIIENYLELGGLSKYRLLHEAERRLNMLRENMIPVGNLGSN